MRRLAKLTPRIVSTLIIGVVLLACSLTLLTDHASNLNEVSTNCSSSCHNHGQNATVTSKTHKEDEDKKEPAPPTFAWPQIPVNLALLYVLPVFGVLWFISNKQKILLTTQLRF